MLGVGFAGLKMWSSVRPLPGQERVQRISAIVGETTPPGGKTMSRLARFASRLSNTVVLVIVVGCAIVTGSISLVLLRASGVLGEWWSGALQNFSTEMLGAFLIFILIDTVIGGREKRETEAREEQRRYQRQLVKRMRSPNNEMAASASEELRHRGWLTDGSLEGVYLSYANLSGLNLRGAVLEGARLTKAKLYGTDLSLANLDGTTLKVSQLAQARALGGAVMPDGKAYDGRLNLKGDLDVALRRGIDLGDPTAMAEFYRVSADEYVKGQEWAKDNLAKLRQGDIDTEEKAWWQR